MLRRSVFLIFLVVSTGLVNLVHAERMYSSGVGRFVTPDPVLNTLDPSTLLRISIRTDKGRMFSNSPYVYGFNNPLRYVDPDGRWSKEVHNRILTGAFKGLLDSRQIKILQSASAYVDKGQSREGSYKHAMRSPGQSAEEAKQLMNEFMDKKLNEFMTKDGDEALSAIGEALHTIMDSTSPVHEGFQVWLGVDTPLGLAVGVWHYIQERSISDEKLVETEEKIRQFYIDVVRKKKEAEERR